MSHIDTIMHDNVKYINLEQYLNHIHDALNMVSMMTDGINTVQANTVKQTLEVSIEFLESL